MNIQVEHKDSSGSTTIKPYRMTLAGLCKHMAFAGHGWSPTVLNMMRTLGMFLVYHKYLNYNDFNSDKFSTPHKKLTDPTEKGQFSNLAGRAIADFLSKKIDKSRFTVNYEAALKLKGLKIKGDRPDLIAFKNKSIFTLEAKGYTGHSGNMSKHKAQSKPKEITVNYTVASVSYNLYKKVKAKYHDPISSDTPFDDDLFKGLTKRYYSALFEFIDEEMFYISTIEVGNEKFYELTIRPSFFNSYIPYFRRKNPLVVEYFIYYFPKLILPIDIESYAKEGSSIDDNEFVYDSDSEYLYIDNDRVGLRI